MSATDATMTVIIDGEERQRPIDGYYDGMPHPELLDGEFIYSVMSSSVPTIIKGYVENIHD